MDTLAKFSEQTKQLAFEKASKEVTLEGSRLLLVTEPHYEKALAFVRDYFIPDEPIHHAFHVQWSEEARDMHLEVLRHHMSLMIVHDDTNDVIALLEMRPEQRDSSHGGDKLRDRQLASVWLYADECERKAKLFDHFNVDWAIQLAYLTSNRKYRHRAFGANIVKAGFAMIRNFGLNQVCVKAEGSSLFTQKIFDKMGMHRLLECMYSEYKIDGKTVIQDDGVHKSLIMYGLIVKA